jgi:hypothetical protein
MARKITQSAMKADFNSPKYRSRTVRSRKVYTRKVKHRGRAQA